MLQKIWSFLTDGIHRREPQPIVILPYEKSPRPQTTKSNSRINYELREAPQQKGDFVLMPKNDNQFKEKLKNNPVLQEQSQDVIEVVRELQQKFKKLSIEQKNLQEAQRRSPIYITKDHKQLKANISEKQNENYLRKDYQIQITTFLQCKYSKQRLDYPDIPFQDFKRIKCYWKQRRRAGEIKKTSLDNVQAITFKAMGGIDHGQWLNDDIINAYLQLLDRNCGKEGSMRLLNSFFATTYLQKDEKMIQRFLKKKSIQPQHSLIMPINYGNHWFFATLNPQSIKIYDSLRKKQENYQEMAIFKNALKFGRLFYGKQPRLEVSVDYPQQNNGNDCGVFMLMGIRDILLGRKSWTFLQGDIRFKRIQLANEVLHESIMFGISSLT